MTARVMLLRADRCTECGDQCIPRLDRLCPACGRDLQERRERRNEANRERWLEWAARKSEQQQ